MNPKPRYLLPIYCVPGPSFNPAWFLWFSVLVLVLVASPPATATRDLPVILALGDSLTAGYGLPAEDSFPAQLEAELGRNGIAARVINGGVSGDTTAGGLARLDWLLADRPDLVIVALGANDALRGVDPRVTRRNLDEILGRIREIGADIVLAGMRAPPNLGVEYGTAFANLYRDLADRHDVAYYPFFLEGVAANPALNQNDGIHPTAAGVAVIVERMLPMVTEALAGNGR